MDAKLEGFDIIVIGGGPAGCYAAKTVAERGLRTLIVEEHGAIGLPRHCNGWLIGAKFTYEIYDIIKDRITFHEAKGFLRRDVKSGDIIEEVPNIGGFLVYRHIFDKEIAKLAVEAGSELMLNTRAVDLIKEDGRVVGVKTNRIPEIKAKVVVCADGILSINKGLARKELIKEVNEEHSFYSGIQLELANVSNVNPGWIEKFESSDPTFVGWKTLWQYSENTSSITFPTFKDFEAIKLRDDNILSKKLKNAFAVQKNGYMMRQHMGKFLEKVVDAGIIYVGDASGNSGTIHGMISGYYAGKIAARAVKEQNMDLLFEYSDVLKKSDIYKTPYYWHYVDDFYGSYKNCLYKFNEIEV